MYATASFGGYNRVSSLKGLRHAYGLLRHDSDSYLLVHVRPAPVKASGHLYPDYHVVVVPRRIVENLQGHLERLWDILDRASHLPQIPRDAQPLSVLELLDTRPMSLDQEVQVLEYLFATVAPDSGEVIGAMLTGRVPWIAMTTLAWA